MSDIASLRSIADEIAVGFEVLLSRLEEQRHIEEDLRSQLAKAQSTSSRQSAWQEPCAKTKRDPALETARAAIKQLTQYKNRSINSNAPAKMEPVQQPRKCPFPHSKRPDMTRMETDFTTQGRPSDLSCPFAPDASAIDPIAAEFHPDSLSAISLDAAKACGRCPIRFIDKHSPEEIAEYFEKHKHELPRSHEICVKRYQANETSIRHLDEKYGNIVSMIQGLGNKHKAYLPGQESSNGNVEKWAEELDQAPDVSKEEKDEKRSSRFDRPLRDVRVGESPSRPWGIHVPPGANVEEPTGSVHEANPEATPKTSKASKISQAAQIGHNGHAVHDEERSRPVQMIFNGPVFFGYSPEDASKLMAEWMKLAQQV